MEAIPGQTVHNPVPFTLPSELDVPVQTLIPSFIWRYFLYSRKADPRHDKDTRQQRRIQRVKALARLLNESLLLGLCRFYVLFLFFFHALRDVWLLHPIPPITLRMTINCSVRSGTFTFKHTLASLQVAHFRSFDATNDSSMCVRLCCIHGTMYHVENERMRRDFEHSKYSEYK